MKYKSIGIYLICCIKGVIDNNKRPERDFLSDHISLKPVV